MIALSSKHYQTALKCICLGPLDNTMCIFEKYLHDTMLCSLIRTCIHIYTQIDTYVIITSAISVLTNNSYCCHSVFADHHTISAYLCLVQIIFVNTNQSSEYTISANACLYFSTAPSHTRCTVKHPVLQKFLNLVIISKSMCISKKWSYR